MDTKKKISKLLLLLGVVLLGFPMFAQEVMVSSIQFCDRSYNYGLGNDSIKIYFNILGDDGKR